MPIVSSLGASQNLNIYRFYKHMTTGHYKMGSDLVPSSDRSIFRSNSKSSTTQCLFSFLHSSKSYIGQNWVRDCMAVTAKISSSTLLWTNPMLYNSFGSNPDYDQLKEEATTDELKVEVTTDGSLHDNMMHKNLFAGTMIGPSQHLRWFVIPDNQMLLQLSIDEREGCVSSNSSN